MLYVLMLEPATNRGLAAKALLSNPIAEAVTSKRSIVKRWEARAFYARLVLSPHPHARITSIDTEAARALPGVTAVYTAADLPLTKPEQPSRSRQPLAMDRVQFDGHPVAIVLAESEEVAIAAGGRMCVRRYM